MYELKIEWDFKISQYTFKSISHANSFKSSTISLNNHEIIIKGKKNIEAIYIKNLVI